MALAQLGYVVLDELATIDQYSINPKAQERYESS